MNSALFWQDLQLGHTVIPGSHVVHGEYVRLVMNYTCQYAFMQHMFSPCDTYCRSHWKMWLQSDAEDDNSKKHMSGSRGFNTRIGSMIRHRGLIANLSLRENLLLPFLYHAEPSRLQLALKELDGVADLIGISTALDEQAGERTSLTHALVSLGRCLLSRPEIIVAQEAHIGMPPEHLARFKEISMQALQQLDSGLLYLTGSLEEGSGLQYARTLIINSGAQATETGQGD